MTPSTPSGEPRDALAELREVQEQLDRNSGDAVLVCQRDGGRHDWITTDCERHGVKYVWAECGKCGNFVAIPSEEFYAESEPPQ